MRFERLRDKLEFGDALLFFYIVVFVRQWFWVVSSNAVAWPLTIATGAVLWLGYLLTKERPAERTPRQFWLLVALPLFAIYLLRIAYPDTSFDVLNHRLIQGERALRGVQLPAGDFFPTIFPFNPLSDMLTGIFRHGLGYRLGTIISYLALVWAGTVVEKLLRPFLKKATWRCLAVLAVLFTEHILFQVNNYMVDLLALPLLLEATRRALDYGESNSRSRDLLLSGIFIGAAVALKLTNAAMVVPIVALWVYQIIRSRGDKRTLGFATLASIGILLPMLPHVIYIYHETGSPFFPLYNKILRSDFWPYNNPYDGRWGPHDWQETFLWPFRIVSQPERLSELSVYSGRITMGLIAAALCLVLPRASARARMLAVATMVGTFLWSATSGYIRYGLCLEIFGGILVISLASYVFAIGSRWPRMARFAFASIPLLLIIGQGLVAMKYVSQTEWSKRPIVFDNSERFGRELRFVLRDRDAMSFQPDQNRTLLAPVEAWIVSSMKTNGIEVLLNPYVPMLAVNNPEYFDRTRSRDRLAGALQALQGKRIYSLVMMDDFDAAMGFLARRKFSLGKVTRLTVPLFSEHTQFSMALVELGLPPKHVIPQKPAGQPDVTQLDAPLDDDAFRVALSSTNVPATIRAGQKTDILVNVRNVSEYHWPARSVKGWTLQINVADSWLSPRGVLVNGLDGRSPLPRDLWPGESAEVSLTIKAPDTPGDYLLEIDMVQEGVTFFKEKDSEPLQIKIRVE